MNNIIKIIGTEMFNNIDNETVDYDDSIVMTAIDSIFSIQTNYKSTVLPLKKRFEDFIKSKGYDEKTFTPNDFMNLFKDWDFNEIATLVFKNKQRTSSTNGILKAEAIYLEIDILNRYNIQTKKSLLNYQNIDQIEKEWRSVKGQGSGITWRYFLMGCGFNTYFKNDTMIYRFFIDELGYKDIRRNSDYEILKKYFDSEYLKVKEVYPKITISKLDNIIWEYMSNKSNKKSIQ